MADPRVRNWYQIWENGEMIFEGTTKEIAEKFDVGQTTIYEYAKPEKKARMKRRYVVVKAGEVVKPIAYKKKIEVAKKKPVKEKESPYQYAYVHLLNDGNTICAEQDLEKMTKYLHEKGVYFTKRAVPKGKEYYADYNEPHKSKKQKGVFYVLERK